MCVPEVEDCMLTFGFVTRTDRGMQQLHNWGKFQWDTTYSRTSEAYLI